MVVYVSFAEAVRDAQSPRINKWTNDRGHTLHEGSTTLQICAIHVDDLAQCSVMLSLNEAALTDLVVARAACEEASCTRGES